jgi:hypothetical protein
MNHPAKGARRIAALLAMTLAFLLVGSFALEYTARHALLRSPFRMSRVAHGNVHVDVVIIGNSRAVNLMTGDLKGRPTVFNAAYNGVAIDASLDLVKDYFQAGNTASTVLIEASMLVDQEPPCDLKPYWGVLPNLAEDARRLCPTDANAERVAPLTRYNGELLLRSLYYLVSHGDEQAWANDNPMTPSQCAAQPTLDQSAITRAKHPIDASKARPKVEALRGWLAAHGYHPRLVFVLAPYFPGPTVDPQVAMLRRTLDVILGHGNWIDLSAALPADCDMFADAWHLRPKGRAAVRERILQQVVR